MNKIYQNRILMAALLLLMIICSGNTWGSTTTNLWSDSQSYGTGWSEYVQIQAADISSVKAGDVLRLKLSSYNSDPKIQIQDSQDGWSQMSGTTDIVPTSNTVDVTVNYIMASRMINGGIIIKGQNFTLTSVDLITADDYTNKDTFIWPNIESSSVITGSWSQSLKLPATFFKNAAISAGSIIRVNVSDIITGDNIYPSVNLQKIVDGSWTDFTDGSVSLKSGMKYTDFVITSSMLADMKQYEFVIKGNNYTITGVQILAAPHDITGMIPNPDFASNATNWSPSKIIANPSNSAISLTKDGNDANGDYSYSQTLSGLPAGYYRLKAQGFQRVATNDDGKEYIAGTETVNANLYVTAGADTKSTPLQSIYSESSRPADIAAAQTAFTAGGYDANSITFYNSSASNSVVIGVKGTNIDTNGWIALDNFRLTYYGSTATNPTLSDDVTTAYTPAVTTGTIKFTRSLSKDKWNTLCVPFDVAGSDLATVFGTGVKVASLDAVTASDGNYNLVFSTLNPQIKANVPCLIKPASDISSMIITNGITTDATANSVSVASGNSSVVMIGNYDAITNLYTTNNASYIISGNKFYKTVSNVSTALKPFRAYFTTNTTSPANQLSINIDGNETTAIDELPISLRTEDSKVYNLNGQMVGSGNTALDNLCKGIYIINGKKIIK